MWWMCVEKFEESATKTLKRMSITSRLLTFDWVDRVAVKRRSGAALICLSLLSAGTPTSAGHGVVSIPSFYPHEIAIDTIDPAVAASQLKKNSLHAYIGSTPGFSGDIPDDLKMVESLDAFLVLTFNTASAKFKLPGQRCAVARGMLAGFTEPPQNTVVHPYPITPFHSDYLQHLDRIEEAKAKVQVQAALDLALRVRATGSRARALVQSRWALNDDNWDVSIDEVPVDQLMPTRLNGWLGPPWMKQGWFHAYKMLAPAVSNVNDKRSADAIYRRLLQGEYKHLTEQLNLERRLIANLTRGCDRVVLAHSLRREYYNDSFSGIEKVAFDSQLGMNSPIFVRTVKLKDFPWNGWLRVGMNEKAEAAWNPIAGFTDGPGRLIWSALGDPAQLPLPYNGSWIPNRVDSQVALARRASGGFKLPANALLPQTGSGVLAPVGDGKFGLAKIVYQVSASRFHDGTDTEVADLLYPYVFAYRWGVKAGDADSVYDPAIEAATALIRERLVGLKVLRVNETITDIAAGIKVPKRVAVVEVYVNHLAQDTTQVAALAPPWSTVPWHVLVLMEEAVQRGFAAFSKQQAERLAVSWLDLARDRSLHNRLKGLVDEFAAKGYRPAALRDLVTADSASARWRALKQFAQNNNHFLVTNGPYRLKQWTDMSSVVQVDRELSYPHGLGSFEHYANPPRAVITEVKREANRALVYVDVEKVVQEQRSYRTVRERMTRAAMRGLNLIRPDSRYLLLGPDGSVLQASKARMDDDGRFVAELPERLPRGRYTFLVAIYLDGNSISPTTRMLHLEVTES